MRHVPHYALFPRRETFSLLEQRALIMSVFTLVLAVVDDGVIMDDGWGRNR